MKALGKVTPLDLALYLVPTLLVVGLVFGYPLVRVVQLSFIRADRFVGLENYAALAGDEVFRAALLHNAQLLLAVPVMIVLAVPLAMLLHGRPVGWRVYRTVIFLPYILAIPVTGIARVPAVARAAVPTVGAAVGGGAALALAVGVVRLAPGVARRHNG